jgi:hypothetical protein
VTLKFLTLAEVFSVSSRVIGIAQNFKRGIFGAGYIVLPYKPRAVDNFDANHDISLPFQLVNA